MLLLLVNLINAYFIHDMDYYIPLDISSLTVSRVSHLDLSYSPLITLNVLDSNILITSNDSSIVHLTISNSTLNVSDSILLLSNHGFNLLNGIIDDSYSTCNSYYNNSCLLCNSFNSFNTCTTTSPIGCFKYKNKCIQCLHGYYLQNGSCIKCNPNCRRCLKDKCLLCKNNYQLDEWESDCLLTNTSFQNKKFICTYGQSDAKNCFSPFNCSFYNLTNGCMLCNNSLLLNGSCEIDNSILKSSFIDITCKKGFFNSFNKCISCSIYGDCIECTNNSCLACNSGVLNQTGYCTEWNGPSFINLNKTENCLIHSDYSCIRCIDGYYLSSFPNMTCNKCPNNCLDCLNDSFCLKCNNLTFLYKDNSCKLISFLFLDTCQVTIPNSINECAICKDSYYMLNKACYKCPSNCTKCNSISCTDCNNGYFLNDTLCSPIDPLCNSYDLNGCKSCKENYYLKNNMCYNCTSNCKNCNNENCNLCNDDYVLINNSCFHFSIIRNCLSAKQNNCIKCKVFYSLPNCSFNKIFLLILIIPFLLIIIGFIFLTMFIVKYIKNKRKLNNVTLFKSKNSNINFFYKDSIMYNIKTLEFGNNVEVDNDSKILFCIGNRNKKSLKIQFTTVKNKKYNLSIEPNIIILKNDMVCEFTATLTPLCSCTVNDKLIVTVSNLNKVFTYDFDLSFKTCLSTKIDPDEIYKETKLGEGSFGIVYKGIFRNHQVAIKTLKRMTNFSLVEFNNEVSMLVKFKCDYIVYFYGSVNLENDFSFVTEFAPFGSMSSLITTYTTSFKMKVKISLDSARGIQYLHSNGILHRDIKPDNILIFNITSFDGIINAKLTDFGSSRNYNAMITNMSFTRGIGTPKYMAPEILDRQHYKKPADIYSFAVTLYELFTKSFAYPKPQFRYEWNIATFVTDGKRLPLDMIQSNDIKNIISNSWINDPLKRYSIDDIVNNLNLILFS